jgi:hypothetical protein
MNIRDDLNNRRIRQLIEEFNAEETYDAERRSALEELRKLIGSNADIAEVTAALRKWLSILRKRPPVNAIGLWSKIQPTNKVAR